MAGSRSCLAFLRAGRSAISGLLRARFWPHVSVGFTREHNTRHYRAKTDNFARQHARCLLLFGEETPFSGVPKP